MEFIDLIKKNRSYRRFEEEYFINDKILNNLVECARYSASGKNLQPLKFILSNSKNTNSNIFKTLEWAGYLSDWDGPNSGERPSAYIVILLDNTISDNPYVDHGIAMQSMLLQAVENGLGGCIIASIKKDKLRSMLEIDERYKILAVVALGRPKEDIKVVDMKDGNYKYWRDKDGIHYVPKRKVNDLIVKKY